VKAKRKREEKIVSASMSAINGEVVAAAISESEGVSEANHEK